MRQILLAAALLLPLGCGKPDARYAQAESYCREQQFEDSGFIVCDNKGGRLALIAAGTGEPTVRGFADLLNKVDEDQVAFAMNAGMFDEDGRPIGLARADGKQLHKINLRDGPGNFHMKPNGVFMVTCGGAPAIFESDSIPEFRCAPQLATQSGPMLVIAGKLHPKFDHDGTSRLIRNGVGVTSESKALFVISRDAVSLGKFARFFRDALNTPNALYFDGAVSSLWDPANGRMDGHSPLGPIIVAFKPGESAPGREARARSGAPEPSPERRGRGRSVPPGREP